MLAMRNILFPTENSKIHAIFANIRTIILVPQTVFKEYQQINNQKKNHYFFYATRPLIFGGPSKRAFEGQGGHFEGTKGPFWYHKWGGIVFEGCPQNEGTVFEGWSPLRGGPPWGATVFKGAKGPCWPQMRGALFLGGQGAILASPNEGVTVFEGTKGPFWLPKWEGHCFWGGQGAISPQKNEGPTVFEGAKFWVPLCGVKKNSEKNNKDVIEWI